MREREARTRGEGGKDDGFSFKGRRVTTRREVADIPLSFIKEGFLSTFARRSFLLSRSHCSV